MALPPEKQRGGRSTPSLSPSRADTSCSTTARHLIGPPALLCLEKSVEATTGGAMAMQLPHRPMSRNGGITRNHFASVARITVRPTVSGHQDLE